MNHRVHTTNPISFRVNRGTKQCPVGSQNMTPAIRAGSGPNMHLVMATLILSFDSIRAYMLTYYSPRIKSIMDSERWGRHALVRTPVYNRANWKISPCKFFFNDQSLNKEFLSAWLARWRDWIRLEYRRVQRSSLVMSWHAVWHLIPSGK